MPPMGWGEGGLAKQGAEDLLHNLTPSSARWGVEIERGFGREHLEGSGHCVCKGGDTSLFVRQDRELALGRLGEIDRHPLHFGPKGGAVGFPRRWGCLHRSRTSPLQRVGLSTGGLKEGESSFLEQRSGASLPAPTPPSH